MQGKWGQFLAFKCKESGGTSSHSNARKVLKTDEWPKPGPSLHFLAFKCRENEDVSSHPNARKTVKMGGCAEFKTVHVASGLHVARMLPRTSPSSVY